MLFEQGYYIRSPDEALQMRTPGKHQFETFGLEEQPAE